MNKCYCVYVHILPNQKRYYGITSQDPKKRWGRNGYGYKQKNLTFYNAIVDVGWDNISHLIIADNLTKKEATELEEQLIREYKTYDSNYGYNKSIGYKYTEEMKITKSNEYIDKYIGEMNPMYGKHHTEESKKKMSESKVGKYTNSKHSQAKKIICITTMTVFNCIKEGAEFYGIDGGHISSCCKGKRNYCGKLSDGTKLIWRYLTVIEL